ncbi:MAG: hypothetical protein ABW217_15285 [Polyangiaceae bacterium]
MSALCGVAALLGGVLLVRAGRASANEALAALGSELMRLPGARYANGVSQLTLNGLTLFVQSGASERAPHEVVAEFRAACARTASLADQGTVSRAAVQPPNPWLENWLDGVLVQPRGAGSAIACIDSAGQSTATNALLARLQRFLAHGDLAELGRLRYAWVEPAAQGSVFLTLWSDGALPLLEQFPARGDAPGNDLPDLQRVEGSRRLLSAALETSALVVYVHDDQPLEMLAARYEQILVRAGYVTAESGEARMYTRPGRTLVLGLQREGSAAYVTLLARP